MSGKSSLDAVFAKRGLWDRLWLAAIDEAYVSRDGQRSMIELQGQTKDEIVAAYLGSHPDIGEWVRGHVEAGTCAVAEDELRVGMDQVAAARRSRRSEEDDDFAHPVSLDVKGPVEPHPVSDRSGAPGAPSSMHLVEAEMQRRARAGEMLMISCSVEAEALARWLKKTHPHLRAATAKSIKNQLGSLYRQLKAPSQNPRPQ